MRRGDCMGGLSPSATRSKAQDRPNGAEQRMEDGLGGKWLGWETVWAGDGFGREMGLGGR